MPIPSSINDLSTTPASNSPAGSESPTLSDDYLRYAFAYIASLRDVVLSGTANLTTANLTYTGTLTGSTGVLNIGSGQLYKDASGNVGIGTASPVYKLDVVGSIHNTGRLDNGGQQGETCGVVLGGLGSNYGRIIEQANDVWQIGYANAKSSGFQGVIVWNSSGNVGIGRVPTTRLDVNGPIALSAPVATAAGTYTVTASDSCVRFTGTGCTVTLPAAASFTGRIIRLMQSANASGAVISAASNVVAQGQALTGTAILSATAGKWADLQSDGTSWWITASN